MFCLWSTKYSLITEPQKVTDFFSNQWDITGHLLYWKVDCSNNEHFHVSLHVETCSWTYAAFFWDYQIYLFTSSPCGYCTIGNCIYKTRWETGSSNSKEGMDRLLFLFDFIHHCKRVYRNCRRYRVIDSKIRRDRYDYLVWHLAQCRPSDFPEMIPASVVASLRKASKNLDL